jgi:hypothetical protein
LPAIVEVASEKPLIADRRAFTVLVRNAVFGVVRVLALGDYAAVAVRVQAPPSAPPWTAERVADAIAPFFEDHQRIEIDPRARGTKMITIDESQSVWSVRQVLCDPEQHDDWFLQLRIDLARANEEGRPILELERIGSL